MAYGPKIIEEVRRSCRGLEGGAFTAAVYGWSHTLGVHVSTVYRWVGQEGRRSRRSDQGRRRVDVSDRAMLKMMALTVRYGMTAEAVIAQAEAQGWIAPKAISVSTYNGFLRSRGVSLKQLTAPRRLTGPVTSRLKTVPHRRWEAPHSNGLHQLDVTELPRYFVAPDGSIGAADKKKGRARSRNGRPRLHLFCLVDDYSRATYARLYFGKHALNWVDFCARAWEEKAAFPFCGCPVVLYSDNDSAPQSSLFRQFIQDVDVTFKRHRVGNPAAKGKVERQIGTLKRRLTALLRVHVDQGVRLSLEEANALLLDLLHKVNARAHAVTAEPPFLRWSAGLAGAVRVMPSEVWERYLYDRVQAVVRGDLTVRCCGKAWQLPRREPFLSVVGQKVTVGFQREREDPSRLVVWVDDRASTVAAVAPVPDDARNFKALPKSRREALLERLYEQDLGDFQAGGGRTDTS